jgi:sugar phosphate isomerase/epimerase
MNKREFLRKVYLGTLGFGAFSLTPGLITSCGTPGNSEEKAQGEASSNNPMLFNISLAQWSLHRTLRSGEMDNLDFATSAKKDFGIEAVEYVNQFFKDKAQDRNYLNEMNKRADDAGVKNLLIMIDGEGALGAIEDKERKQAVENHHRWVEAAKYLGCHSIRVNAAGNGTAEEVGQAAIDGLGQLATFAKDFDINVIVENHGGYSSNGQWLSNVIAQVNMDNCGTLPDFGNFCIRRDSSGCAEEYDRYKGIKELMPYAKGVSAKSHDFNEKGDEIHTDYRKALQIVKDAGYRGYIGIEYEGGKLSEPEGIKATKALLEKVGNMS